MNPISTPSTAIQLIAHRGYAARFPENSREALTAAVDAGATFVEFDVQLSADAVPFLLHDEDFKRTACVELRILDIDATQVASINVGEPGRFGSTYTAVQVPRLSEIVDDLTRWESVTAFVELKQQSIEHFGLQAVLDAVLPILEPVIARCVVISFDFEAVCEARRRTNCRIGWVLQATNAENDKLARSLAPDFLFCDVLRLPPLPQPLWQGPWDWAVYEVNAPGQARDLNARGVCFIETMAYPELAAELVEREIVRTS